MIGISGSLIWSETLMELIFNRCGEFRLSPERPVSKSTLLTSSLVSWDLFRSFKVCSDDKERVECGKNGNPPHLFIPSNTATLVTQFRVEDLPLGRTEALVPELAVKDLPWAEHSDDIYIYI